MPQKMLILIDHARSIFAPALGIGSFIAYLQTIDFTGKPIIAIAGSIIIAFFTYLGIRANARTKVEVKEIETTQTADVDKAKLLIDLFNASAAELERHRQHFNEGLKEQRDSFFEKEKEQRTDFFDKEKETREHYEKRKDEMQKHFENREEELRQSYHNRLAEAGKTCEKYITRCTSIEAQLKALGIELTDRYEIILPLTLERRKPNGT